MKVKANITAGVLGMGFYTPLYPTVEDLWSACVNGERNPEQTLYEEPPVLERIIEETVSKAATDASILGDNGFCENTRLVICCDTPLYGHQGEYLQPMAADPNLTLRWQTAPRAQGFLELETVLCDFLNTDADYLIICAVGIHHAVECAAVVLGNTDANAASNAYAVITQLAQTDRTEAETQLKTYARKGLGYLLAVAGSDVSNHREIDYKSAPLPLPEDLDHGFIPFGVVNGNGPENGTGDVLKAIILASLGLNGKIVPASPDRVIPSSFFRSAHIYLNESARPWIKDRSLKNRCAAVAGFAAGQLLPLLMLEEVDPENCDRGTAKRPEITGLKVDTELIVLSGESLRDLLSRIETLWLALQQSSVELPVMAGFLANVYDSRMTHRLAIITETTETLLAALETCFQKLQTDALDFESDENIYFTSDALKQAGKLACLFPGLGFPGLLGPYIDNLMDLCLHFPDVRSIFDGVDLRDHQPDDAIPTHLIFFRQRPFPKRTEICCENGWHHRASKMMMPKILPNGISLHSA